MIAYRALRGLWSGRLEEARQAGGDGAYLEGRLAGLQEWYDTLGLEYDDRSDMPTAPLDERGMPVLKEGRLAPREVSIRLLAESLMGHEFVEEYFHPNSGFNFSQLREAAIDPTAFVDINVFKLATFGLLGAEIMERFNYPAYIGRTLVRNVPSKTNGGKLIAVARQGTVSKASKGRQPGEAHTETGFGQAYQTWPETEEQALKCLLTREAVYYDITDQVEEEASNIGDELSRGQEVDIADGIMGVTSSYNRNGTSYGSYQTATPFINDHANPFSDITDLDDARQLFVGMRDPENGREIDVNSYNVLCMPARELKFREQLFAPTIQAGTQLNSGYPQRRAVTGNVINQVGGGTYTLTPLTSIWYNRATASDGLNLSASDAKEYWWVGEFNRACEWRENWPLTPWMASADEFTMKDRGLVMAVGANYRGVFYFREPRRVVRNKAS